MRNTALAICSIPALFFLLFAIGEISGGDTSGLIHFLQLLILGIFLYISIKKPYIGGLLMLFSGFILSMEYVSHSSHMPMQSLILVISLMFLPLIMAGILFISYGRGHKED